MAKEKKAPPAPTPFWGKMVEVFFNFCEKKFSEKPSFDGSAPRDLKAIVEVLKKRAESSEVLWTEEVASSRLEKFLEAGFSVPWLRENFLLQNLNRQKDKIFFNIKQNSNGAPHLTSSGSKPNPTTNTSGNFGRL